MAAPAVRAGYTLAFVDADARRVVDAVFGDMLRVPYTIDPKVSGSITLRSAAPVDRDEVVALLERALEPIGAAAIWTGTAYRVVPREAARAAAVSAAAGDVPGSSSSSTGGAGFGGEPVRLRYANARDIERLVGQFVGKDVVAGIDPSTNTLLLAGSADDRAAAKSIIRRFDVDNLAGATFQLIHLDNVDAEQIEGELKQIFRPPLDIIGNRVRLVALPRLHSLLAIASDSSDIQRIQPWIQRLDAGGASAKRKLYNYAVQNGRARDLAASLQLVLGRSSPFSSPYPVAVAAPVAAPLIDSPLGQGGLGGFGGGLGGNLAGTGVSTAAQTLQPAQVIGAETPLPGNGPALTNAPGALASTTDVGPRIVPVEPTNSLLIYANGEEYDFIRQALDQIDKPVPQIMIEATLAEVTLTRDLQYGVNWSVMSGNSTATLSNTASAVPLASFPGFSYAYIGKTVQAVLNTLQSKTNVRVLSAPKLMVLNNQTATLQVGDQVPIVTQQSQATVGGNSPLINTVELHDTGVILKVTPRVNDNGAVTLDIAQEVSDVVPTTTSGINSPTIQQRRLTSTIATRSGQMVALGGLIRDTATNRRQGFPGLSQIPVVGALFGQQVTTGQRTELIILLTPVVLPTVDQAHAAVDELISRMPIIDAGLHPPPPTPVKPRGARH